MEERTQTETYLGYDLVLTAQEMSRGWSWGYLIDGRRGINRFGTEMPDVEAALGCGGVPTVARSLAQTCSQRRNRVRTMSPYYDRQSHYKGHGVTVRWIELDPVQGGRRFLASYAISIGAGEPSVWHHDPTVFCSRDFATGQALAEARRQINGVMPAL